jgi:hypothetical protein
MSGQSANLSIKEATMMQKKIQHSGSHASTNGGSAKSGTPKEVSCHSDPANAHNHK